MINILREKYECFDESLTIGYDNIELDLGCGSGSFTVELAKLYPNKLIIAVDIKLVRLKKLMRKAEKENLSNIYVIQSMAWDIVTYFLPDNFLERVHILCPDPWPKFKHRYHRLLSSQFLGQLSKKIKIGGSFHFSTDNKPYYIETMKIIEKFDIYNIKKNFLKDILHIKTSFEKKWLAQNKMVNHIAYENIRL